MDRGEAGLISYLEEFAHYSVQDGLLTLAYGLMNASCVDHLKDRSGGMSPDKDRQLYILL